MNAVQVCDRRWAKSLVVLFLITGLLGVAAPAYAEGTIIGTLCKNGYRQYIELDAAGNVYTACGWDVQKITPDGVSTIILEAKFWPEIDTFEGLSLDAAGNVYTVSNESKNVSRITPDGVLTILGTVGPMKPWGPIAVDVAGNVWVSMWEVDKSLKPHKVTYFMVRITADGVSTNLGEVPFVNDMAVDAAGNVYIPITNAKAKGRKDKDYVLKITPAGKRRKFSTGGNFSANVVVDAAGNIYTANQGTSNISRITPDGRLKVYGKTGWMPSDITVDAAGNVYTANYWSNNVSKITPAGVSTILGETGDFPEAIVASAAGDVYVIEGPTAIGSRSYIRLLKRDAKKTTIMCKKGDALKNVTALKPLCPKGWKKEI